MLSADQYNSQTRRAWLSRTSLFLGCTAVSSRFAFGEEIKPESVEVTTAYGRLRGQKFGDLTLFRGIPYGGSVSGANRFKAAPPLQPWTAVRDAVAYGTPSPQPNRPSAGPAPEDCLVLNVWTPAADGRKRPVMFYSHGGGFTSGSAASDYQDGGNLARTFDVVVVATNHRLGLMGYLDLRELGGAEYATSGNQGLLDIRDGLKWVHENIQAFGGDPNNVMIFGESGGGAKTSCLYALPSAAPYFNKASIESGPGIRMTSPDAAAETAMLTLQHFGLGKSQWRKMLEVPLDQLMAAQTALAQAQPPAAGPGTGGRRGMGGGGRPGSFGPVVDGSVLPHHPFDPEAPAISKNKPLIVGYNHDEAVFFFRSNPGLFSLTAESLKQHMDQDYGAHADAVLEAYRKSRPDASPTDLYIAVSTARMMGFGSITIAQRKYAQHGAPVYAYVFVHETDALVAGTQHKTGAAHATEIPYKFYNVRPPVQLAQGSGRGPLFTVSGPTGEQAAHNMAEMWSTFARTGHPAAKGQPAWPAYTAEKRSTMEIDANCKVVDDPNHLERDVWERLDL